jgi:hypothetical protein
MKVKIENGRLTFESKKKELEINLEFLVDHYTLEDNLHIIAFVQTKKNLSFQVTANSAYYHKSIRPFSNFIADYRA